MKRLILLLFLAASLQAQTIVPVGGVFSLSGTGGGGGSGTITAGTTNHLPKYTAATTIGDSLAVDDGTTFTYTGSGGGTFSGPVTAGGSGAGALVLPQGSTQSTGTTNITIQAPVAVTSYIRTLPGAVGSTGYLKETVSGSVQTESLVTASGILDDIGSTRGSVLYRGASGWAALTPGTSGQALVSNGAGADPSYQTVSGGSGIPIPAVAGYKFSVYQAAGTTVTTMGDTELSTAGTRSIVAPDANNGDAVNWVTAATTSSNAGFAGNAIYRTGRNIVVKGWFRILETTNTRFWLALTDNSLANMVSADDPGSTNLAGIRYSTVAGDTTFRACSKNATTLTNTSTTVNVDTSRHFFSIVFTDGTPNVVITIDGTATTLTTNLPSASTNLALVFACQTQANEAKNIRYETIYLQSDK